MRLDAKASHFTVGFEPTYGHKGLDNTKKANNYNKANDSAKLAENKQKMAACNIVMAPSNETSKQAVK